MKAASQEKFPPSTRSDPGQRQVGWSAGDASVRVASVLSQLKAILWPLPDSGSAVYFGEARAVDGKTVQPRASLEVSQVIQIVFNGGFGNKLRSLQASRRRNQL